MADYIKREALIEHFEKDPYFPLIKKYGITRVIEGFPAADVRPVVRGKWLPTNDANKKRCSECGVIHLIAQYPHGEINFCPNCGADMRESAP